uniref:Mediator of RNA polymerase II transcription subunit 29 n=1 Tax=Corvus moneduloides TaxID=1196302 RepID=A0A8U7N3X3_CORMO
MAAPPPPPAGPGPGPPSAPAGPGPAAGPGAGPGPPPGAAQGPALPAQAAAAQAQDFDPVQRFRLLLPQLKESLQAQIAGAKDIHNALLEGTNKITGKLPPPGGP